MENFNLKEHWEKENTKNPVNSQKKVLKTLFSEGKGKVLVSAGAGTGKTQTMVWAVSEAVLRLIKNPDVDNPFEEILVVTFTVEAARELKEDVLESLEELSQNHPEVRENKDSLKAQLENDSWISTLDSFTRKIIKENIIDIGIGNLEEEPDSFEIENIREEIISDLREEKSLKNNIDYLEDILPVDYFQNEYGWESAVWEIMDKARGLGIRTEDLLEEAKRTLNEDIGYNIDEEEEIDSKILEGIKSNLSISINNERLKEGLKEYEVFLDKFKEVCIQAEELYDKKTKPSGKLTHDDVRFHIVNYLRNVNNDELLRELENKFGYVFIDEFQDTSHAQCELIKHFISNNTRVALIGDVRQSIYQWREADPQIFSNMLSKVEESSNPKEEYLEKLDIRGFERVNLIKNFRFNNSIKDLTNTLFGNNEDSLFKKKKYQGRVNLPSDNLEIPEKRKERNEKNKIHIYRSYENNSEQRARDWAENIAKILSNIKNNNSDIDLKVSCKNEDNEKDFREPELGDCWILIPTRSKWQILKEELTDKNIEYVMAGEKGLFKKSPSVQIIIDLLNWIRDPYNFKALSKIIRSPLMALKDSTLSYIAYHDFDLFKIIKEKENLPEWIDNRDINEIEELIKLREVLRWKREGRKSELIEEILQFSALDNIILSWSNGKQELANIWQFQEIIDAWEEDELLSYSEFLERLEHLRDGNNVGEEYRFAPLADQEEDKSVKIITVHSSKGREFPIEFIYNPDLDLSSSQMVTNHGNIKVKKKNDGSEDIFATIFLTNIIDEISVPSLGNIMTGSGNIMEKDLKTDSERSILDKIILDKWSEQWRLFYVAITRAKDHLFIPYFEENNCASWDGLFPNEFDESILIDQPGSEEINNIEIESVERSKPEKIDLDTIKFSDFKPESVSGTHLYDLYVCPRKYQFVQLQKIAGQEDCEGNRRPEGTIFGNYLHKALEVNDINSEKFNTEFAGNFANEIEEALISLKESNYLDELINFEYLEKEKEIQVPLEFTDNKTILKGKIDLISKNKEGIVIVDYKTGSTEEDSYQEAHELFQLKSYAYQVNKLTNESISKLVILRYDRDDKKWSKKLVDPKVNEFEDKLKGMIPTELDENGLKGIYKSESCDNCQFNGRCSDLEN